MASIHDRGKGKPSRWQVKWRIWNDDLGRWEGRSESFAVHADAKGRKAELELDARLGTLVDPRRAAVTFAAFVAEVRDDLERPMRATSRARFGTALSGQVLPFWRRVRMDAITHDRVAKWIGQLEASGLAPATIHKAWQTFRKIVGAAVDRKVLAGLPFGKVGLPPIPRHEARFLTPAEVDRLADAIGDDWRAFVYVGALCGLRAGELFGLRWSDVDLAAGELVVRETATEADGRLVIGEPKTAAGRRRVPVPRVVIDELELHRLTATDPDAGVVFPTVTGRYWRAGQFRTRVWKPATVAAGLGGLVIHELRHTAVAAWIDAGATPTECAARAGHESVVTILDRYGHRFPAHGARVNDALDAAYRASREAPPKNLSR